MAYVRYKFINYNLEKIIIFEGENFFNFCFLFLFIVFILDNNLNRKMSVIVSTCDKICGNPLNKSVSK